MRSRTHLQYVSRGSTAPRATGGDRGNHRARSVVNAARSPVHCCWGARTAGFGLSGGLWRSGQGTSRRSMPAMPRRRYACWLLCGNAAWRWAARRSQHSLPSRAGVRARTLASVVHLGILPRPSPSASIVKLTIEDNRSLSWTAANRRSSYVPRAKLERDLDCDVAIVGGGFTGVSAAYHLARRFPERRIVLCEARRLANGASGRSGGLVLNGVSGVSSRNLELAQRIYETTRRGIDSLEARIREHGLDVPFRRDGCLEVFTDPRRADAAAREVERLASANIPVRFLRGPELRRYACFEGASGAVLDPTAGQIDGVRCYARCVPYSKGGRSRSRRTPVLVRGGQKHTLSLENARLRAKALVLATNAYTPQLGYFASGLCCFIPRDRTQPSRRAVARTRMATRTRWLQRRSQPHDLRSLTERGELCSGAAATRPMATLRSNASYRATPRAPLRRSFAPSSLATSRRRERSASKLERLVRTGRADAQPVPTMGVMGKHRNVYFALGYSGHGITLSNLAGEV